VIDLSAELRRTIRDVPDFPKPGILFKDITPVLADPSLFRRVTDAMASPFEKDGVTHVAGIESRGFILGAAIAQRLGAAFVPVRKPGKLPAAVERVDYALEYGTDALEVHRDALHWGNKVLVADDVLATGGTASAACALVEQLGAQLVGCSFMLALAELKGGDRLAGRRTHTLVEF